jgi:hypothetical protein
MTTLCVYIRKSLETLLRRCSKTCLCVQQVVQATMVRDRQHGPVIELNRIQVKRSRSKGGLAGPDGIKSVFGQMVTKMSLLTQEALFLPHRVWKVKFVGKKTCHITCNILYNEQCEGSSCPFIWLSTTPWRCMGTGGYSFMHSGGEWWAHLAVLPLRKELLVLIEWEAGWVPEPVWMMWRKEKSLALLGIKPQFL